MPLLEVTDLKKHYAARNSWFSPTRHVRAVDGVSLTLDAGETLGLVGESGCGKTTLGKMIVRLETPTAGKAVIKGRDIASLSGEALRQARGDFQMIFQDPYGSLNPKLAIGGVLDEILYYRTTLDRAGRRKRAAELMELVGLEAECLSRYPNQFSGGQRQRIGIARALAVSPALIVADEPVSALDVSVQAQIVNLLREVQRKTGVAYLFIAHDLALVERVSDRIAVMYLGKLVETGEAETVRAEPLHPYTMALLSAVPVLDRAKRGERILLAGDPPSPLNPPTGCAFHPRCPNAAAVCREKVPPLAPFGDDRRLCACFFPGKPLPRNAPDERPLA